MKTLHKNPKLVCFCCGSELTAPQYYKGEIYGYTCIKKVAPNQKQSSYKPYLIESDNVTINEIVTNKYYEIKCYSEKLKKTFTGYKRLTLGNTYYYENILFNNGKYLIDLKQFKHSDALIQKFEQTI